MTYTTTPADLSAPHVLQHGLTTVELLTDTYPCLFDPGLRWDGWYLPWFSLETGLKLAQELPGLRYDAARDCFVWPDDDSGHTYFASQVIVAGVPLTVYPIGQRSLFWSCSRRFRNEAGEIFQVQADGSLRGALQTYGSLEDLGGEVDLMDDQAS